HIQLRQPLVLFEGAVELGETLGDLALALLELCLGLGERRGATVERRSLSRHVLFEADLSPGDLDLLAERRPQILLAGERRAQLGTEQLYVRNGGGGDRLRRRAGLLVLAVELCP